MQVLWGLTRPYLRVLYIDSILPVERRVLLWWLLCSNCRACRATLPACMASWPQTGPGKGAVEHLWLFMVNAFWHRESLQGPAFAALQHCLQGPREQAVGCRKNPCKV